MAKWFAGGWLFVRLPNSNNLSLMRLVDIMSYIIF